MDGPNGFLFKPKSSKDGRLAILTPESVNHQVTSVVLKDQNGKVIEKGHSTGFGDVGTREKFAFQKPGGSYPRNLHVEVSLNNGAVLTYIIPDPTQRVD